MRLSRVVLCAVGSTWATLGAATIVLAQESETPAVPQPPPTVAPTPEPSSPATPPVRTLPFRIEGGALTTEFDAVTGEPIYVLKNGMLASLDTILKADRIAYSANLQRIEARGNVVLTRGDEVLRGDVFVFEAGEGGEIRFENATIVSPPYFLRVGKARRVGNENPTAEAVEFTPAPGGEGEFSIRARRMTVLPPTVASKGARSLLLEKPSFYLFGTRIITLPRRTVRLRRPGDRQNRDDTFNLPLTFRTSQIAGLVVGLELPFALGFGVTARAAFDLPSQRAFQTRLTLDKEWSLLRGRRPIPPPSDDDLFFSGAPVSPPSGPASAETPAPSRLRRLLTARPKPGTPDPLLEFVPIIDGSLLESARQGFSPTVRISLSLTGNQEVTDRRRGLLLLSRRPEVNASVFVPLGLRELSGDITTAKAQLRSRIRPAITVGLNVGDYRERQIGQERRTFQTDRTSLLLSLQTLPYLIGDRLLLRGQINRYENSYGTGERYRITEEMLSGDFLIASGTFVGASYFTRQTGGRTPLGFDFVDTPSELRLRGQTAVGKNGRYALALTTRHDIGQGGRLFDYELGFQIRGRAIETRVSYGKLGNRIGFGITIPRLLN